MYKTTRPNQYSGQACNVLRLSDNAFIPFDTANTDAVEFAQWLKDGNKPEPAEEGGVVTDEWVAQTIALLLPNG